MAATSRGVADVGLAHLDEASAARQEAQRGVDELAGEGVEDDVDAVSVGGGAEGVLEVEGAGGGDLVVGQAESAQGVPLGGAGGGVDVGAPVAGELDGGHADAAGGGVDEEGFALAQSGEVVEGVVGRHEDDRYGRGLGEGPALGHRGDHAPVDDGQRAEGAGQHAHDAVAGGRGR
ncbi:hypothetical protein GCM10020254_75370 [Streptomyces goshikiensis]